MRFTSFKLISTLILLSALSACGGGGGGDDAAPASLKLTVTGTAATGLAIAGATVTGKCKVGTDTATTLANGSYTLEVTNGQLPCVLQITNPVDGTKLHTLVLGTANTAVANITPLTEMTTARVLGSEPNVFFAAFNADAATQKVTTANIAAAQTAIGLIFTGTINTSGIGDFITTPLVAATQSSPTSGDAQDKLLDVLKLKLSTAQIGMITTALAGNQTADAIKQTVINLTTTPVIPPVANAGAAQSVVAGTTVTLDASTSSAAAGKSLTYAWTLTAKPTGSAAILAVPNIAKPTFVADVAGSYVASVIVNDGTIASSAAAVNVTASVANAAPVANAGVAQNVVTGSAVTLDGSTSSDANSDSLTYAWTLTSKPTGSLAILSSISSAKPIFTADISGTYVASLVVNDGKVNSNNIGTVSVTAAVLNAAPVANAGIAQNVVTGTLVTLDGSASSDANSDPLTYAWTLTAKPAGSSAILSSFSSAKPTFIADIAGTYVTSLMVNDGKVNSKNIGTVSVTAAVLNAAPVANAGIAQNVVTGTLVTLDGSASSDANSDPLTYAWTLTAKPAGSSATLSSFSSAKPTFIADIAGTYVASLTVNDGKVNSTGKIVAVTAAVANVTPVANAGPTQSVATNILVTLSGIASSDANSDPLTYTWTLISKPIFSSTSLRNSTSVTPSFMADVAGTYIISLVVNDGIVNSNAATVAVTAVLRANPSPIGTGLIVQDQFNFQIINDNTMISSLSSSCGRAFNAIDQRPDGVLIGMDSLSIYEIDVTQPACINKGKTHEWINTLSIDSTGQYWGISLLQDSTKLSQRLYRINPDGSSGGYVYLSGATQYITGMDFHPNGDLIGIGIVSGGWGIVKVNTNSGATTHISMLTEHPDHDIDIDNTGVIRGVKNGELLYLSSTTGSIIKRVNITNFSPAYSFAPIVFVK